MFLEAGIDASKDFPTEEKYSLNIVATCRGLVYVRPLWEMFVTEWTFFFYVFNIALIPSQVLFVLLPFASK